MAAAPPVHRPRTSLHVRGSWSARDDGIPSVVWLGIFMIGTIAGFGVDIPGFLRLKPPPRPKSSITCGFTFTAWLLILTAQVLVVLSDRVAWHKRLGWACLMAIFGPWAALSIGTLVLPHSDPFLSVQLIDIVAFLGLLTGGFTLRRNPAAHRRMMMQATASIADPGFSGLEFHFFNWHAHAALLFFLMIFYGNVLIVALMAAWDCWRGRLMRSFVIGAAALVAVEVLMILGAKVADNSGFPSGQADPDTSRPFVTFGGTPFAILIVPLK